MNVFLDLGLHSNPKEFGGGGMESEFMLTPRDVVVGWLLNVPATC